MARCACPCGEEFEPKRRNQVYLNAEHRKRDTNRRWPVIRQSHLSVPFRSGQGKRQESKTSYVTLHRDTQMADPMPETILRQVLVGRHSGEEWLTRQEVADLLGVTRWTVWYWGKRGLGPSFVKLVGRVRYPRRDFDEWVASLPRN